jgi:CheY-like chemotaxis protein
MTLAEATTSSKRILVVEDEPFIALTLADTLRELGFVVAGCVGNVAAALELIGRVQIDGALLDVSLGSQRIDPVADLLAKRSCPFIFTTAYGRCDIPAAYCDHAVLQKPFGLNDLVEILGAEFGVMKH